MGGGALILRTMPNSYVNNERLQSSSVFIGTIVRDRLKGVASLSGAAACGSRDIV